jgi:acyl-CoA synthetase (AMP-forming)/AMP-acid ligase II
VTERRQDSHANGLEGSFETVDQLLLAAAVQFPEREAYVEGEQRLTYRNWAALSDKLAAALAARGVGVGDVVAMIMPSSIDYAICYGAIVRLRAVATGLNPRLGRSEVSAITAQCSPSLVIVDDEAVDVPLPPEQPLLTRSALASIYAGEADGSVPAGRCAPDDPVTIMWTSGTTGCPKGAYLDHRNLRAIAEAAGPISAPGDRKLMATPFVHAGYMSKLWDQIATGSTVVMSPSKWSAGHMLRQIVDERVTVVGAVPTQWEKLLALPELASADLSGVRIGTCATAPARPELVEAVRKQIGCPLIVRYAMTESPSICGTAPEDPPDVQFQTVGRPQHGMEVSIDATPGEVGVIRIRGGCVMRGYWNAPELTAEAFDDGWLASGDLGYLRPDGNLVIAGRASDMYIRGGYNIYPAEVEAVLMTHPGIAAASVVGTPAPVIGEVGVAFVVPSDPRLPPTLQDLRTWVCHELADYKAPDRLELVEQLPTNEMHKVNKRALRELAAETRRPATVTERREDHQDAGH